jgi:hypothetical protein
MWLLAQFRNHYFVSHQPFLIKETYWFLMFGRKYLFHLRRKTYWVWSNFIEFWIHVDHMFWFHKLLGIHIPKFVASYPYIYTFILILIDAILMRFVLIQISHSFEFGMLIIKQTVQINVIIKLHKTISSYYGIVSQIVPLAYIYMSLDKSK